jgi:hypothetical protein
MQRHLLWPRPGQTRRQSVLQIRDSRRTSHRQAAMADYAGASALLRRALRRFAAFLWMIPRLAALSIADISRRICSVLAGCAERAPFCIVRKPVTTLRLRSVRFALWRARLAADLVLAIGNQRVLWNGTLVTQLRLSTAKSCLGRTVGGFPRAFACWARRAGLALGYRRLFNASFAFCRSAASAPAIRICSAVTVLAGSVGSV